MHGRIVGGLRDVLVLPTLPRENSSSGIHFSSQISKFALRTVVVAATATVSDEQCCSGDDWHIKKVKMHDIAGLRLVLISTLIRC